MLKTSGLCRILKYVKKIFNDIVIWRRVRGSERHVTTESRTSLSSFLDRAVVQHWHMTQVVQRSSLFPFIWQPGLRWRRIPFHDRWHPSLCHGVTLTPTQGLIYQIVIHILGPDPSPSAAIKSGGNASSSAGYCHTLIHPPQTLKKQTRTSTPSWHCSLGLHVLASHQESSSLKQYSHYFNS